MQRIATCMWALVVLAAAVGTATAEEIIIDDLDSAPAFTITDDGGPRTNKLNMYASHCYLIYGGETATYTPTLAGGVYAVYVWNPTTNTLIVDSTTTVYHAGGSSPYTFNQTTVGGHWHKLGVYNFGAGSSGYVTVTSPTNYAYADAVRFDTTIQYDPVITPDNYTTSAGWFTGATGDLITSTDGDEMSWTADGLLPGTYDIQLVYSGGGNRVHDTIVQVWEGSTKLSGDIVVDQYHSGSATPGMTADLGTYDITGTEIEIRVLAGSVVLGETYTSSAGVNLIAAPIPEPATACLLAAGAVALLRRRRTRGEKT